MSDDRTGAAASPAPQPASSPARTAALPLDDYIASCAFLHDDWDPHGGKGDWGQYDTLPFLLGAPVCIAGTLRGFGQPYIDYLRSLGAFPERLITPEPRSTDLTANLLADEAALAELRGLMAERRLDLSLFYSTPDRFAGELIEALSSHGHRPRALPHADAFTRVNRKLSSHDYFEQAGIPSPEYALCESPDAVRAFFAAPRRYPEIIIKADHRHFSRLGPDDLGRLDSFRYPLIAETCYQTRYSPSVNCLVFDGSIQTLFTTRQHITGLTHWGNDSAASLPEAIAGQAAADAHKLAAVLPPLNGVLGVDYILTVEGELLAVDINPRFCSPTYPFYLLMRLGFDLKHVHARYRLVKCPARDLSQVLADPDFAPLQPGHLPGMFVYGPVVYDDPRRPVAYFSTLLAADSPDGLAAVERRMQALIGRLSAA